MNATDLTAPCALVQYGLIMLMCGRRKMEFLHDGKPIGWNAESRTVECGYWKTETDHPMVFHRRLIYSYVIDCQYEHCNDRL